MSDRGEDVSPEQWAAMLNEAGVHSTQIDLQSCCLQPLIC